MPTIAVVLVGWHIVSRVLFLYFYAANQFQSVSGEDQILLGWLVRIIGVAFFILVLTMVIPRLLKQRSPHTQAPPLSIFIVLLAALVAVHDVIVGSMISYGSQKMVESVIWPLQHSYRAQIRLSVPILFYTSLVISLWCWVPFLSRNSVKRFKWFKHGS